MLHLAVEPDYDDEDSMRRFRKSMKNWDKKLDRCQDEMLIYIRERINYLIEVRSQNYLEEMEK